MFSMQSALGGRVTIDAAQIGGSIVAILLRNKKLSRVQLDPNKTTYHNDQYRYLSIPVNAKLQESYTYSAEVTRYPVESGSIVSDHVIIQPLRIDLNFEVANADGIDVPKRSLEMAIKQLESRQPVTLVTQHASLDDMVCTNIQADNQAPLWGKLAFRASFQQVKQVSLQNTSITPDMIVVTNKMPAVPGQPAGEPYQSGRLPIDLGKQPTFTSSANTAKGVIYDMRSFRSGMDSAILGRRQCPIIFCR